MHLVSDLQLPGNRLQLYWEDPRCSQVRVGTQVIMLAIGFFPITEHNIT